MNVDFMYSTAVGRVILKGAMNQGARSVAAAYLRSPASKVMIRSYIKNNGIDMSEFEGQKYRSFAEFFIREKDIGDDFGSENDLISPCDGLLSVFPINENSNFYVKGSWYQIEDLIPDKKVAEKFVGGSCFIYRLEASDYHRFCYIDDCYHREGQFMKGKLHSVQPIACEKEPVYRLNRRMWSLMETEHFGEVAQIEVGALLVGGIVHDKVNASAKRGEEMGRFELAGSTIIQLFTKETKEKLRLLGDYGEVLQGEEVRVRLGQIIGGIKE